MLVPHGDPGAGRGGDITYFFFFWLICTATPKKKKTLQELITEELLKEIQMLASLRHPDLVLFMGAVLENKIRLEVDSKGTRHVSEGHRTCDIYIYICTYIYIYIHKCIHIYIHIYVCIFVSIQLLFLGVLETAILRVCRMSSMLNMKPRARGNSKSQTVWCKGNNVVSR